MLSFASSGLLIVITLLFYQCFAQYYFLRKKLKSIPGPYSFPFIGITWKLTQTPLRDRFRWFNNLCFEFKNGIVLTWIGTDPIVTIRKPHQIQTILSSSKLITKTSRYDAVKPWLGEGLLTAKGERWLKRRRLLTPTFHFGALEEYSAVMFEKVDVLIDCINEKLQANPRSPINVFEMSIRYTLDTICKTAMGVDIDSQRKTDIAYVEALHNFAKLEQERFLRPWLKWNSIYYRTSNGKKFANSIKIMQDFTAKVIEQKQIEKKDMINTGSDENNEFDEFGKRKRKAFLDLMLDESENSNNPLTLQEIREEVDTFMFAGHDTTATAISWTLYALGNAPDVQVKLREEFQEIFGPDSNERATVKQIGQLKYLDRVIKEALRIYAVAPAIARCLDEDVKIDDHIIPKGTYVVIHIYQCHNDPEIWKDPKKFDPDRFLPENSQGRHPYAFIPFSAGPRNCIGQKFGLLETKIVLTAILRRWFLKSVLKPSEISMINNFVLRPVDDKIEVFFTPTL